MSHRDTICDEASERAREELDAYYQGPADFVGPDEVLERLCAAAIELAELEERTRTRAPGEPTGGRATGHHKG